MAKKAYQPAVRDWYRECCSPTRKITPPTLENQADVGGRTRDLRLTMAALYQLSYVGAKPES
jgi:hypothetical protein